MLDLDLKKVLLLGNGPNLLVDMGLGVKFMRMFRVTVRMDKLQAAAESRPECPWLFYCRGECGRGTGFRIGAHRLLQCIRSKRAALGIPEGNEVDLLLNPAGPGSLCVPQPYVSGHAHTDLCTLEPITADDFDAEYRIISNP